MQHQVKSLMRGMHFLMKLKRLTLLSRRIQPSLSDTTEPELVPGDVKKGHFAVLAAAGDGEEQKRFVVGLHHLRNPEFLRLLDEASEEYGFRHRGLLVVPCSPQELERILKS